MAGAAHQVGMMQVVGLDPRRHQSAHQLVQGFDVVIDAGQQHALAHQREAGIGQLGEGGARLGGQFAGVIAMDAEPQAGAPGLQR